MSAPTSDLLQISIEATRRQIESLGRRVAEVYPGDNKMAWPVTIMLKELKRFEVLSTLASAESED